MKSYTTHKNVKVVFACFEKGWYPTQLQFLNHWIKGVV